MCHSWVVQVTVTEFCLTQKTLPNNRIFQGSWWFPGSPATYPDYLVEIRYNKDKEKIMNMISFQQFIEQAKRSRPPLLTNYLPRIRFSALQVIGA